MTNFDYVQKTIDLFEDSLGSGTPITTVRELSKKIGYSPHHLGRLFQSLCGEPLGQYLLRRRLSEAVHRIRDAGAKASQAACQMGWEDYSSFGRAVRREFKMSPGQLAGTPSSALDLAIRARPKIKDSGGAVPLLPDLLFVNPLHVTGLVFNVGPNEKNFHRPWRIFSVHRDQLRGQISPVTYQFSWWAEASEPDEGMWIHCAAETDPLVQQEPIFFSRSIPGSQILRFIHRGPVELLFDTYRRIWEDYLPQSTFRLSGSWEFQRYLAPGESSPIEICLPITDG